MFPLKITPSSKTSFSTHVFPLYKARYPDGRPRVHHGLVHALRTYFFSMTFAELYREKQISLPTDIKPCLLAAALHDCARENDGVDLWDKQSGEKCKDILCNALPDKRKLSESAGEHYSRCIAEKDSKEIFSVEQKIIHDADCIEILRCLYNPEDFKPDELRALKDLDAETVFELINEAKSLIGLTELPLIKSALEESEDPIAMLYQLLEFSFTQFNRFSFLKIIHGAATKPYIHNTKHLLSDAVESEVCRFFSKNI